MCGADGKMVVAVKNGLVLDDDGEIRYYENDTSICAGLVQDADGNYVIVDTPPLDSVIDAAVIASNCDGSILIIGNRSVRAGGKGATGKERKQNP